MNLILQYFDKVSIAMSCGFQAHNPLQRSVSFDVKSEMNVCFRKLLLKVCRYIPALTDF